MTSTWNPRWKLQQRRHVTHVAMETTGVLWKPVWKILEGGEWEPLLVIAKQLKQEPERRSDVKDCQWSAHLHACGLLSSSFCRRGRNATSAI